MNSQDLSTVLLHWGNCFLDSEESFKCSIHISLKDRLFLRDLLICLQNQFCYTQCLSTLSIILTGVASLPWCAPPLLHHPSIADEARTAQRSKHASCCTNSHSPLQTVSSTPFSTEEKLVYHLLPPFCVFKVGGAICIRPRKFHSPLLTRTHFRISSK